jgi:hypothetical protein
MFDFQKEVILNNLDNVEVFDGKGIRIDGMLYKKEYIKPVYKTEAKKGSPAKLTIDIAKLRQLADERGSRLVQFVLELSLDNDYRGDWGSVLYYFRKPVVVNLTPDILNIVASEDVPDNIASANKASIEKAFNMVSVSNEKLFKVSFDGNKLVLDAADNYIIFSKATVMSYLCSDTCSGESMEVGEVLVDMNNEDVFVVTENARDFGTYEYMIHNLRLPTHANWRFTSPAESEMPIKGAMYDQYSFEYTVPRRLGGLSVAGQKTESTTIHTFFVLQGAKKGEGEKAVAFDKMLESAGVSIEPVNAVPYVDYAAHSEAAPIINE